MRDIDFEIRMQLLRVRSDLSLAHADALIRDIACSCLHIREDETACGIAQPQDFCTFCHVNGIALVCVWRGSKIELFTFSADESLIHETEHLAMADVEEFMHIARSRFQMPDTGLVLPISQALPWIESYRESNHVA